MFTSLVWSKEEFFEIEKTHQLEDTFYYGTCFLYIFHIRVFNPGKA